MQLLKLFSALLLLLLLAYTPPCSSDTSPSTTLTDSPTDFSTETSTTSTDSSTETSTTSTDSPTDFSTETSTTSTDSSPETSTTSTDSSTETLTTSTDSSTETSTTSTDSSTETSTTSTDSSTETSTTSTDSSTPTSTSTQTSTKTSTETSTSTQTTTETSTETATSTQTSTKTSTETSTSTQTTTETSTEISTSTSSSTSTETSHETSESSSPETTSETSPAVTSSPMPTTTRRPVDVLEETKEELQKVEEILKAFETLVGDGTDATPAAARARRVRGHPAAWWLRGEAAQPREESYDFCVDDSNAVCNNLEGQLKETNDLVDDLKENVQDWEDSKLTQLTVQRQGLEATYSEANDTSSGFVEAVDKEKFDAVVAEVKQNMDESYKAVQDEIDRLTHDDKDSVVLAAVLGTLGGLVLVAFAGVVVYKYKKSKSTTGALHAPDDKVEGESGPAGTSDEADSDKEDGGEAPSIP